MKHIREKLRHTDAKLKTKYGLWRFDRLQLHSALVYSRSQGFVVMDYSKPQRQPLKQQWTQGPVVLALKKEAAVGGTNHGNQSCDHNRTQISKNGMAAGSIEIILLHDSSNNLLFVTYCFYRFVNCWLGCFKCMNVGAIQFCLKREESDKGLLVLMPWSLALCRCCLCVPLP